MYTNQNNYLQYSCFLSSCQTRNDFFFFQFYSFWLILFKYPYCNRIVIVKVIMITGCFAIYSITITITCNHKNKRLQITFRLLKTCNRLHVITITDYNYNRSGQDKINGSALYDQIICCLFVCITTTLYVLLLYLRRFSWVCSDTPLGDDTQFWDSLISSID